MQQVENTAESRDMTGAVKMSDSKTTQQAGSQTPSTQDGQTTTTKPGQQQGSLQQGSQAVIRDWASI